MKCATVFDGMIRNAQVAGVAMSVVHLRRLRMGAETFSLPLWYRILFWFLSQNRGSTLCRMPQSYKLLFICALHLRFARPFACSSENRKYFFEFLCRIVHS